MNFSESAITCRGYVSCNPLRYRDSHFVQVLMKRRKSYKKQALEEPQKTQVGSIIKQVSTIRYAAHRRCNLFPGQTYVFTAIHLLNHMYTVYIFHISIINRLFLAGRVIICRQTLKKMI